MSYCDAIGTIGILLLLLLLIYATDMYIYFISCDYLLPEQSLNILLCKSNSTSWTFPLSGGNPTIEAAFTEC